MELLYIGVLRAGLVHQVPEDFEMSLQGLLHVLLCNAGRCVEGSPPDAAPGAPRFPKPLLGTCQISHEASNGTRLYLQHFKNDNLLIKRRSDVFLQLFQHLLKLCLYLPTIWCAILATFALCLSALL